MYRYFHGSDRNSIPTGLPARLVDPTLRTIGDNPQFLRIGEGNEPRNELLRVINQYPSKDEVRTKVLSQMFPPTDTDPYFSRPDNIAAIRTASEQLGIPLERTGLRIATNPFRLEGNVADVNLLAQITNKAAGDLKRSGKPTFADALTRKAQFFNQPRSYRELAVDGSEGIDSIIAAYEKAEPRVTASSQGNRPILIQADGLDPNIGIPTGSPENIPPMDIEGRKGANRYVDVSQGLQTARVIRYPGTSERLGLLAQQKGLRLKGEGITSLEDLIRADKAKGIGVNPVVTPTIPYSADIPTTIGDSILSPKVSIETKRPRFIDEGHGIYTRQGERINTEQRELLATGMADLEDRSFILRDPASADQTEQYRPTTRLGLQTLGLSANVGRETITPSVEIGDTLYPSNSTVVRRSIPINRLTDDLSNRVLSGDVDLRNYVPFKSNRNTYGVREGKTPWREYYSDPFVYEDKGLDGEANRLMRAISEAPAQLENAYTQQALANRRAIDASDKLKMLGQHQSVRMGLLPQGEGVVNLAREVRKDRRMAEIDAAKAQDTIAQLRAAQELLGVEYMVKPKLWGDEVLNDYAQGSRTKGAMKDSSYDERLPATDSLSGWRQAISAMGNQFADSRFDARYLARDRDYDIASAFGFSGNY